MNFDFIVKGGPVMIPLFVISITAFALIIERAIYFKQTDDFKESEFKILKAMVISKNYDDAIMFCSHYKSPVAGSIKTLLESRSIAKDELEHLLDLESVKISHQINKFLYIIKTLPNLSTLLGLLGTVTGMIKNFIVVAQIGTGDPAALAGGISEALITTATGLIIAIPVMFLFTLVDNKANDLEERMYIILSEIKKLV